MTNRISTARASGRRSSRWLGGARRQQHENGLAGLILALEAIVKSGVKLRGDVSFGAVVGEIEKAPVEEFQGRDYSGYGIGSKHLVSHGVTADYALLAEPTSLRICTANMGCLWVRVTVGGGSMAHSALTNKPGTVNAISRMAPVLAAIEQWAVRFRAENTFMGEQANVTVACIRGGAPWRLSRNPQECSLYLDIRTLPGQTADHVKRQLRAVLRQHAQTHGFEEPALEFLVTDPARTLDHGLPIVGRWPPPKRCDGRGEQAVHPPSGSTSICRVTTCHAFSSVRAGACIPTRRRSMHEVGDHVLLDDVVLASRIYLATALDLCNRSAADNGRP